MSRVTSCWFGGNARVVLAWGLVVTVTHAGRRTPKVAKTNSVVKKAVMAVSGIVMVLYLIAHMIGNLKVFTGAESFNYYSEWIRSIGTPATTATSRTMRMIHSVVCSGTAGVPMVRIHSE